MLFVLFFTFGSILNLAFADKYSMRRCMILPITDTLGNSVGFKIFEDLEKYIKRSKWCSYVPSSGVLEIFSKYRDKLPEYLNDEKVLKTVADRLRVGTIIRVKLNYDVDKLTIKIDIIGENGQDLYFSEKAVLNKIDVLQANATLINWLELYESNIPYDGRIIGVLGDQVTFTYPKHKNLSIGQEFKIKRFIDKKRHPLLKKIVEWNHEVIAKGNIFNLSRGQSLGVVKVYTGSKKLESGDWVRLGAINTAKVRTDKKFSNYTKQKFGRLGDLAMSLSFSSHTAATTASTGTNALNGFTYGLALEVETWITRNYVVLGEFSKKLGNLKKSAGTPSSEASGQNTTTLKVAGGYKYLPMGFFYGPQINFYAGYAKYNYSLDTSSVDGYGENSFSGILLGVGGNIPLKKGLRVFASGEIMPFAEFADISNVYSTNKSVSSMVLEVGANYLWSPTLKILGSLELINNAAKFKGANPELRYSDTSLKLGGAFSF